MSRIKILQALLLVAAISSCSKDDLYVASAPESASDEITFGATADWTTKGQEVNSVQDAKTLTLYSYLTESVWGSTTSSSSLSPFFSDNIETPITLTYASVNNSVASYTYEGAKYWPSGYLTFFAYYPESELSRATTTSGSQTFDSTTGNPQFSYTLSPLAQDNEDLIANVQCDQTYSSGTVQFGLEHLLTKISLAARLSGIPEDAVYGETYEINGVSFIGLYDNATLNIATDGTLSWDVYEDDSNTIELTAAQGATIVAVGSGETSELLNVSDYSTEPSSDNNYYFTDVMSEDKAIFVLPQDLGSERTTAPTMQVRFRRTYYLNAPAAIDVDSDGYIISGASNDAFEAGESADSYLTGDIEEIIYQTVEVEIPAADAENPCWVKGQEIQLNITLDISELSAFETPMSLTSQVLTWTEAEVEVDIHKNIYTYSSLSTVSVQEDEDNPGEYYGEFIICTNYEYNLRVPHHREELDGVITSSRGFLFCSDDFNNTDDFPTTYSVGTINGNYQMFVPTLLTTVGSTTYEIVYATETNIESLSLDTTKIYEYLSGFGTTASPVTTDITITYGSNGYAYIYNSATDFYRLLYIDPTNTAGGSNGTLTAFNYDNNTESGYHEIRLSAFADDDDNTVNFKIKIADGYEFDFSVRRSTRVVEGLYTSSAIGDSDAYGVNKESGDAVYFLRLSVNAAHLAASDGKFDDIIGVEMISNGGGMITTLFPVTLDDSIDSGESSVTGWENLSF